MPAVGPVQIQFPLFLCWHSQLHASGIQWFGFQDLCSDESHQTQYPQSLADWPKKCKQNPGSSNLQAKRTDARILQTDGFGGIQHPRGEDR